MKKFLIHSLRSAQVWWCIISVGIFIFIVSGALVATMQAMTAALQSFDAEGAGRATGRAPSSLRSAGQAIVWLLSGPIEFIVNLFF
jgi:hypothetical protein